MTKDDDGWQNRTDGNWESPLKPGEEAKIGLHRSNQWIVIGYSCRDGREDELAFRDGHTFSKLLGDLGPIPDSWEKIRLSPGLRLTVPQEGKYRQLGTYIVASTVALATTHEAGKPVVNDRELGNYNYVRVNGPNTTVFVGKEDTAAFQTEDGKRFLLHGGFLGADDESVPVNVGPVSWIEVGEPFQLPDGSFTAKVETVEAASHGGGAFMDRDAPVLSKDISVKALDMRPSRNTGPAGGASL